MASGTSLFEAIPDTTSYKKCVLCGNLTHFANVLIHAQQHLKHGDKIVISPNKIEVLVDGKDN